MKTRLLKGALAIAVLGYVVTILALFLMQRHMIFPGTQVLVDRQPPAAPGLEVLSVPTSEGTVEALFLPSPKAAPGARQPVVIYAHGNGEVTDYYVHAFEGFRDRGIGVLLVEYPGYGRSTGKPSEHAIRTTMDAAYDHLVQDPRVDRARIVGFGQSLGGGAICNLARDRPLRAMILQSTFPTLRIFAANYHAPAFLMLDRFDNESAVRTFPGPILVIHGRQDALIHWSLAERMAKQSPHATFRLYECGHGCWDPDHLPFWSDAVPFLVSAGVLAE